MSQNAPIQHYYSDDLAVCYGCGRHNAHGLHVQTQWDGKEGTCRFTPRQEHTAIPGYVYGGLLASLIDCHGIGTATAAMYDYEGRPPADPDDPNSDPIRCVTGQLNVTYLKPTPLGPELILRATVTDINERRAKVACSVYAPADDDATQEIECVRGEVVAVRLRPENMPKPR